MEWKDDVQKAPSIPSSTLATPSVASKASERSLSIKALRTNFCRRAPATKNTTARMTIDSRGSTPRPTKSCQERYDAKMITAACAMLIKRITPKIKVRPLAISAYMPPTSTPRTSPWIRSNASAQIDVRGGHRRPPPVRRAYQEGLGLTGLVPLVATFAGSATSSLPFCHWIMSKVPPWGRPAASQPNLPSIDCTWLACSQVISLALSTPPVAWIASASTSPAAYASAASAGTTLSLFGKSLRYPATNSLLPGTLDSCSQSRDVIVPSALVARSCNHVLALSGPLAKYAILGWKPTCE